MRSGWIPMFFLGAASAMAAPDKQCMRDFVGINGHFQFKPALYSQVCGLVRNYHNINWDVKKPGDPITFPICANKVDWNKHVYGKWQRHGFEIDLCAQFGGFGERNKNYRDLWRGQEKWFGRYGYEMAKYFGPSGTRKLITSIEIGNEPGNDFDDALYRKLFIHMARGIRKGDPKMRIVTATARPGKSDKYSKSLDETFSSPEMKALYDVINVHVYAVKPKKKGQSPWDRSYPEDPALDYLKIVDDTTAWRDRNAKGKAVWITEFGYDSCTPAAMKKRTGWAKKLNWQGVTDLQQAQYILRSIFCFAERPVERAYIYFFNDEDKASVHAASGLTRKFVPKPAFWAVKHLYDTLGDYRFARTVTNDPGKLYVQAYAGPTRARPTAWIVWSPTGNGRENNVILRRLPGAVVKVERMAVAESGPVPVKWKRAGANAISLMISESPTYLLFRERRR